MNRILPYLLLASLTFILTSTSTCILEPDKEFIYSDTTLVDDTIQVHDTITVYADTLHHHDTTYVQVTTTIHDTLRLHDTTKITVRDTTVVHDTMYLLNVPPTGAPNLISITQAAGTYNDFLGIVWCKVEGAIGYRVYFSTAMDSVYTPATGDIHPNTYHTPVQEWLTSCSAGYFYMDTYSANKTGTYFFKITAVDGNGLESTFSNVKAGYFNQ